ncbi:hypothetical protein V3N99_13055 [Dermatophilaceae bacterium Soc4.6]
MGLVLDDSAGVGAAIDGGNAEAALLQRVERAHVDWSQEPVARRILLRFHSSPLEIRGASRATGVALDAFTLETPLVVTSIGRRGRALPGLPFDEARGTVPHSGGRVVDPATGQTQPGMYVAGWIKRGFASGIGANRFDVEETVDALVEDAAAGAASSWA